MALFTFKGGVHPADGKELAKDSPIVTLKPQGDLVFPVSQHIGAPAVPVVKKGDEVLRGGLLAEAGGFVSAPVYSSVSGTVKGIERVLTATGGRVEAVVVESDGLFNEVEFEGCDDPFSLPREEIIKKIQTAGVVGMGGAGFPTHVKLSPKEPEKIEYIIANCAECEPYITADYRRMLEDGEKIVEGLRIVLSLFDNARGILAIEDNKPDCIAKMTELTKNDEKITVCKLETKYPQGGERQLIYATTKRAINSAMLPADAGCIVDNVETLINVYKAVRKGIPTINRVTTVSGDCVKNPGNFRVYMGTKYSELIEAAGGFKEDPKKVISGGPMMGFSMFDLDVPVTKTSSAVLAFSKDAVAEMAETACINCGRCVEVCPSRLVPSRLADYAENKDEETFVKWQGLECMECGCCSYVCPAKRPLKQAMGTMRKQALANKKKS
ncbi:RnfABCDGE-type electron transport complex C subunit [Lachnospiraceae bacterium PF1-21]|uniref:Ion-translocating oxidoreductase complex subunit C n=1 Tax=Ohessyouella blattaphilus TaxID=2949333 RepID=A0ABT1EF39_9FIRM|nr:electron transport complex subunit RsxC [Ohessyouella blattaphilus]MCP1109300.1 electron transport complex subunit RsxC [Ohessyouella blattaphilus]MCR8562694.1 electron transport complex subunit RsxC [Ohessyouella blattaphilus]MDL2249983.1 electron transport complex subunit RsxC [Lachnospiraceae bacterium OttesenSCG-928-J05]